MLVVVVPADPFSVNAVPRVEAVGFAAGLAQIVAVVRIATIEETADVESVGGPELAGLLQPVEHGHAALKFVSKMPGPVQLTARMRPAGGFIAASPQAFAIGVELQERHAVGQVSRATPSMHGEIVGSDRFRAIATTVEQGERAAVACGQH